MENGKRFIHCYINTKYPTQFSPAQYYGGFKDKHIATDKYVYGDLNGNMTADKNKDILSIEYNHLNLPFRITFSNDRRITYVYDAMGVKLKKLVVDRDDFLSPVLKETEYAGGIIYENGVLEMIPQPEGYIQPGITGGYDYVYQYKDHLGNIRLSYSDIDGNGSVNSSEILSEKHYYPFGLDHKGYNNVVNGTENKYQTYQGQELEKELGKDTYAYQWRDYDPAIARFNKIDRFAEKYEETSPYAFVKNSPIRFREVRGDSIDPASRPIFDGLKKNINNKVIGLTSERDAITASATNRRGKVKYSKEQKAQVSELNYRINNLGDALSDLDAMDNSKTMMFSMKHTTDNTATVSPTVDDVKNNSYTIPFVSNDIGNQVHEIAKHGGQIANGDILYGLNAQGTGVTSTISNGNTRMGLELAGWQSQYSYTGMLSPYITPLPGSSQAFMNQHYNDHGTADQRNQLFKITNHSQITISLLKTVTVSGKGSGLLY